MRRHGRAAPSLRGSHHHSSASIDRASVRPRTAGRARPRGVEIDCGPAGAGECAGHRHGRTGGRSHARRSVVPEGRRRSSFPGPSGCFLESPSRSLPAANPMSTDLPERECPNQRVQKQEIVAGETGTWVRSRRSVRSDRSFNRRPSVPEGPPRRRRGRGWRRRPRIHAGGRRPRNTRHFRGRRAPDRAADAPPASGSGGRA